jgi:hypothetical protein
MTNKELRDLLEQFDDDLPVEIFQYETGGSCNIEDITIEEVSSGFGYTFKFYQAIILK